MLRVRQRAQKFWFWLLVRASAAPLLVRVVKPFFVWFAWNCSVTMRRATRANARRLLGESSTEAQRTRLGKTVVGNTYDFIAEFGRHRGATWRELLAEVESVEGHERYVAARAGRRGAIIATSHMGSFEVGVAALRQYEEKIHVVFKRDWSSSLETLRRALHARLGIVEAPVEGDGLGPWLSLREALARDEVVLLQADRVMPGQRGVLVPFLGGHIETPPGPVKLVLACERRPPIVPVFAVWQPSGKIRLIVEETIEVEGPWARGEVHPALARLMGVIEKYVRRYPEQWLLTLPALVEDADQV